jgi:hypothetical protein
MLRDCAACAVACQDFGAQGDRLNGTELTDSGKSCHDCEGAVRSIVKSAGGQRHWCDFIGFSVENVVPNPE